MRHITTISVFLLCILPGFAKIETSPIFYTYTEQLFCERAFLGINSSDLSEAKAKKLGFEHPYGSYVTKVVRNSAAEKSGLQVFDYIVGINDDKIDQDHDLVDLLNKYQPGDEATVHFIRGGAKQSVQVRFGKQSDMNFDLSMENKGFLGVSEMDNNEANEGIRVSITKGSTAESLGMQSGDIITAINGHPMIDWEDVTVAIRNSKVGEDIKVEYVRNNQKMSGQSKLQSRMDRTFYRIEQEGDKMTKMGEKWLEKAEKFEHKFERKQEKAEHKMDNNWTDEEDQAASGDYAFLGIHTDMVSREKATKMGIDNPYGSLVTKVLENTAAQKAGLRPFDFIYGVDEFRTGEEQGLVAILKRYTPGQTGTLHIIRLAKKITLKVTFGRKTDALTPAAVAVCDAPFLGIRDDYGDYSEGIKVNIVENSSAEGAGLKNGDIVTHINGYPMIDWSDITILLNNLKKGDSIEIDYKREGKKMQGKGTLKSKGETKECDEMSMNFRNTVPDLFEMEKNLKKDLDKVIINRSPNSGAPATKRDVSNFEVKVDNLNSEDATNLNSKTNGAFSNDNTLNISNLSVSPNPTAGMFKLQFSLPSKGSTGVKVYNAAGRAIYEYDLGTFSGDFSDDIDISQNGSGQYYLEVKQGAKSAIRKILLNSK